MAVRAKILKYSDVVCRRARFCNYSVPENRTVMRQPTLHLFIFSYAIDRPPRPSGYPSMPLVNCANLPAPPDHMCHRYTGLNPRMEEEVFSEPRNERVFQQVYRALKEEIRSWDFSEGANLEIPVACTAGCHRSVAMAERLGREISYWRGAPLELDICVMHLNVAIKVIRRKRQGRAQYGRYRDLTDRVIIGEHGRVTRIYRNGRAYNVE